MSRLQDFKCQELFQNFLKRAYINFKKRFCTYFKNLKKEKEKRKCPKIESLTKFFNKLWVSYTISKTDIIQISQQNFVQTSRTEEIIRTFSKTQDRLQNS